MSEFGRDTTTDEVLEGMDLTGRRFLITGAASGLGRESARALAAHGATVTVLARSPERAEGAVAEVGALVPGADLEAGVADLGDMASIRAFAGSYLAGHDALDVLFNNAGVMACPLGRTADGFETQFGTNHLGHFLLTALLYPALQAGDQPRVVTLTLGRPQPGRCRPGGSQLRPHRVLALGGLRAGQDGQRPVRPGAGPAGWVLGTAFVRCPSGRDRHRSRPAPDRRPPEGHGRVRPTSFGRRRRRRGSRGGMAFKTVEAGAATQVWAATTADLPDHNGAYLADCWSGGARGRPRRQRLPGLSSR